MYLLFREAAVGVIPSFLPLDAEVGGGAMLRNVVKSASCQAGNLSIIPRPKTLGYHFLGITGAVNSEDGADGSFEHTFTICDQFETPWYTGRSAPGNLLGEQMPDMRYAGFGLAWRAGRFVEGSMPCRASVFHAGQHGGLGALPKVDGGPQFLAPLGTIELPGGTPAAVTAGAFTAGIAMPTDEQMIVGSYVPQNLQHRAALVRAVAGDQHRGCGSVQQDHVRS